jgi:glucose/arabinose dehydrogenase
MLCATLSHAEKLPLTQLKLPSNYAIKIFAEHVENARQMTLGDKGTVFVGTLNAGNVYAITSDKKIITIASKLNMPNGVAFYHNALYVTENDRILRFDNIENQLAHPPRPVLIAKLPSLKHHGWRYIKFGPDNKLYVGIGAPCNICLPTDYFATIIRMNPDGSNFEVYARGIRNTVGFDWNPTTSQLWFTENGRDWLGDNVPPDELNYVAVKGSHFGFPFCHGSKILDPTYGKNHSCDEFVKPALELPAHVAPLGMIFYTGKMFPHQANQQIFLAEHGSWNRSSKVGYQILSVNVDGTNVLSSQPFITGWLNQETVWGRPVDLIQMPDGSLLISDDFANVIYHVTYNGS